MPPMMQLQQGIDAGGARADDQDRLVGGNRRPCAPGAHMSATQRSAGAIASGRGSLVAEAEHRDRCHVRAAAGEARARLPRWLRRRSRPPRSATRQALGNSPVQLMAQPGAVGGAGDIAVAVAIGQRAVPGDVPGLERLVRVVGAPSAHLVDRHVEPMPGRGGAVGDAARERAAPVEYSGRDAALGELERNQRPRSAAADDGNALCGETERVASCCMFQPSATAARAPASRARRDGALRAARPLRAWAWAGRPTER